MQRLKFIILFLILIGASPCAYQNVYAQCKAKQIMKGCKPNVPKPYKYDSYAISDFTFDKKAKSVEVEFTAFQGQKYKLIFCSSGFDEAVKMNIYDKSNRIKLGRTKLYDNSQGIDNNFWSFEPSKSGNYYIDYDIPPSTDGSVKQGCVVMLIGYAEGEAKK